MGRFAKLSKVLVVSIFLFVSLAAYGQEDNTDTESMPYTPTISKEVFSDIIKSIPSPFELLLLIKDLGIDYDATLLNPAQNNIKYQTKYSQALNLGIYNSDVGYAAAYDEVQDALSSAAGLRDMVEVLELGEMVDFKKMTDAIIEIGQFEVLSEVNSEALNRVNYHLQENGRSDLVILTLTGAWLESLYINCKAAKKNPNELLKNRIGEQKLILDQLILLLSFYEEAPAIKHLTIQLNELQKTFDNVKITYSYEESTTEEENGIIIVKDNTQSKINLTKKDLDSILAITAKIRKTITE